MARLAPVLAAPCAAPPLVACGSSTKTITTSVPPRCTMVAATARCDIKDRGWSPPARPAPEVDFGQGLTVGAGGPARFVCAGHSALNPSAPKLAYGTASNVGTSLAPARRPA